MNKINPYPKFNGLYQRERAEKMTKLSEEGYSVRELADKYNIGESSIRRIINDWRKVEDKNKPS